MDDNKDQGQTVPVLEEELRVGKRLVEKERLVLRKTVSTHTETVEVPVQETEVSVERVPVGRTVTEPPPVREEGEWLIIPLLEEVLVVEKRLVLKEELRIRRQERTRTARETVELRSEQVAVEHAAPQAPTESAQPDINTKG